MVSNEGDQLPVNPTRVKNRYLFISIIFVSTCSERHLYRQVKRTQSWMFTLSRHTVTIQIETFFDCLTKDFTDMVKIKGGRHIL